MMAPMSVQKKISDTIVGGSNGHLHMLTEDLRAESVARRGWSELLAFKLKNLTAKIKLTKCIKLCSEILTKILTILEVSIAHSIFNKHLRSSMFKTQ